MRNEYSPNDMMRSGLCIGCGSCVAHLGNGNAEIKFDKYGQLKPDASKDWMNKKTEVFGSTCPFSPVAIKEDALSALNFPEVKNTDLFIGRFQSAYVGHVAEDEYRINGSSGGMVSWMAAELLKKGLVDGVAHVVAAKDPQQEGRFFHYRISKTIDEVKEGAKSRYYPVELSSVIKNIKQTFGRYAVVGVPCFIKAIQLLRQQDEVLRERIQFTLGLFCGHMKSAGFVESFAWQLKVPVEDIVQVEYRKKDATRPANIYTVQLFMKDGSIKEKDWWHLADGDWGAGFFMNHACNFCDDVVAETADIAFGDAWVEPYSSDGRGTNVVVTRSPVLESILKEAIVQQRLSLTEVDARFIQQTQAAGLRQRREGLAYRLKWVNTGNVHPKKRVAPSSALKPQRKIIYRLRYYIAACSHKMFSLAKRFNKPQLYLGWAKMMASIYHGYAYHKGKMAEMKSRFKTFQR